jgi:hypothetical protein
LLATGLESTFNAKLRPFCDTSVKIAPLLEYAATLSGLPVGDEMMKDPHGNYPDELLQGHTGMKLSDYCFPFWVCIRKVKFDDKGPVAKKGIKKKETNASSNDQSMKKTAASGALDEDEPRLDGVSEPDSEEDEDKALEGLLAKRKKRKEAKEQQSSEGGRRDSTATELRLYQQVHMAEAAAAESKKEKEKAERQLVLKDQQDIPDLDGAKLEGFRSMGRFKTITEANGYEAGQLITALLRQGKTKLGGKRPARFQEAPDTMNFAMGDMEREYDAGDVTFEPASEGYKTELMRRFWYKWEGDYVKDAPQHVKEQDVADAQSAWNELRPSYYLSPESWWKVLLKRQFDGGKIGYLIDAEMLNKKFFETLLPPTASFRAELPPKFKRIKSSRGLTLMNKVLIGELYSGFQLFSHEPLINPMNKNQIGIGVEMDPDKPSYTGRGGKLGPVPMDKRTAELGYPVSVRSKEAQARYKAAQNKRKKVANDSMELEEEDSDVEASEYEMYSSDYAMREADALQMKEEAARKKDSEPAGADNKHGVMVPGWFRARYPHIDVNDFKDRPPNPWAESMRPEDYKAFYETPAEIGQCCMGTRIFHNGASYRAAMKKYNCTECQCISGISMDNGKEVGEDLSKWATLKERTRIKELMVQINQRRKQKSGDMSVEAKQKFGRQCQREKRLVESQATAHWKYLRQLEMETPSKPESDAMEKRAGSPPGANYRGTKRGRGKGKGKDKNGPSSAQLRGYKQMAESQPKEQPEEGARTRLPYIKKPDEALKAALKILKSARREVHRNVVRMSELSTVQEEEAVEDSEVAPRQASRKHSSPYKRQKVPVRSQGSQGVDTVEVAKQKPVQTEHVVKQESVKKHPECAKVSCVTCPIPRTAWVDAVVTEITHEMQREAIQNDAVERASSAKMKDESSEGEVEEIDLIREEDFPPLTPQRQKEPKGPQRTRRVVSFSSTPPQEAPSHWSEGGKGKDKGKGKGKGGDRGGKGAASSRSRAFAAQLAEFGCGQ